MHTLSHGDGHGASGGRLRAWAKLAASLPLVALLVLRPLAVAAATAGDRIATTRSGSRTLRAIARALAPILGLRVTVRGPLPGPGPCMICPNHVSYLDVLVLASVSDAVFVSRGDVAGWPVVGFLVRLGGTIFVDRSRKRDAARAADDVGAWLDRGLRVVVFLEGRVAPGDAVLPFRPSLLEPAATRGTPCHGATIRYSLPSDPGATVARDVSWHDETPFTSHVFGVLRLRRIDVDLTFHAPRTGDDRKALAAALESDCRGGLGPPPSAGSAATWPAARTRDR